MKNKTVLGVFLAIALAGLVRADIIDFATGTSTDFGTLTYAGGAAPLIGSNILIGQVSGVSTPSNNGVTDPIINGILSFTTGAFVSYDPFTDTYKWGPGGSITINGSGPGCLTIGTCGGNIPNTNSGPNLLTGTIVSAEYIGGDFEIALAAGGDTKDPLLVKFFGFDPAVTTFKFSGSVHATITSGGGGNAFTAQSTHSTDIKNTAKVPFNTSTVPEHSNTLSLLLLGVGALGLAAKRFA